MYYSSLEPVLRLHHRGLWLGVKSRRTVSWGVVRLLVGRPVVIVEVVLSVSAVPVVPLQLKIRLSICSHSSTPPHLGFEGVVLLAKVLLPVLGGVAPVPPLGGLLGGAVVLGSRVGGDTGHQSDQN